MNVQTFDWRGNRDSYLMLSADDLPRIVAEEESSLKSYFKGSWVGESSFNDFKRKATIGDPGLVAASEAMLQRIEDQVPMSRAWRNLDDVVGAIPNIPAFLAGHPQCMRRRERTRKDTAPLCIYMDLTSSGGISAKHIAQRGITLLALTRVLVEHRPVELWVGASLGHDGASGTTAWRIDTAPLDLARAAYHISATAMSRTFGYQMCRVKCSVGGNWPFANYTLHCDTAERRLAAVLPGREIMYIPPIYLGDSMTADPVGWVKRVLNLHVEGDE